MDITDELVVSFDTLKIINNYYQFRIQAIFIIIIPGITKSGPISVVGMPGCCCIVSTVEGSGVVGHTIAVEGRPRDINISSVTSIN